MEYNVISTKNLDDLIKKVNSAIEKGWEPMGGVCESANERTVDFYQAMIKK